MKKIAVYIADQQDSRLKALAKALGVTQAELLRQALEDGLTRLEREQASTCDNQRVLNSGRSE